MKVMIDATPLLLRSAGVKAYLYHWIQALRVHAGAGTVLTFPPIRRIGPLHHEGSVATGMETLLGIGLLHHSNKLPFGALNYLARGADVFHASNQIRKPPSRARLTATIHDLTCWRMPDFHTRGNVEADRSFAHRILKQASGLIAVSENTRRDAIELLGIHPDKVVTIHSGVPESYFSATEEEARLVVRKHRLSKPYVLCVGTVEPRKNIDRLLDAWASNEWFAEEFDLVLAGPAGWGSGSTLARLRSSPRGVRWLGYVAEDDMPGLTRGATLLAYPSLYEGFGFPVAQAMAAGVPVITSNTSSLPEVAGPGAVLVDPHSVSDIGSALSRLLESVELRSRLGSAGREWAAARYRWQRAAAESWTFFSQVMGV